MLWASSQKNIDGIFQPVVEDKRFIYHIGSRTLKLLEATDLTPKSSVVVSGKYKFNNDVFVWAKNLLLECLNKNLDWLVIDEVGRLELNGKGLEPVIGYIINNHKKFDGNIALVVRDSLLEKFVERFNLENNYQPFVIE
jgi:nucleoside-triphosphatase THEP1